MLQVFRFCISVEQLHRLELTKGVSQMTPLCSLQYYFTYMVGFYSQSGFFILQSLVSSVKSY